MNLYKINSNLYDIRLDLDQAGVKNFLSTWVYKDDKLCFIVDPGPSVLIDSLKQALNTLKIGKNDLNYILLTHVHIDHAGGTGKLISFFPNARVVCHPRGMRHLVDPERLWDASVKTLGDMASIYQKIIPSPLEKFASLDDIEMEKFEVIETLGHAPHHQSYLFKNYLFIGEVGGTHKEIDDKSYYLRPATPPIFDYNAWKESIRKLLEKQLINHFICYPHYGMRPNADLMLRTAEHQLSLWVAIIEKLAHLQKHPNFYNLVISEIEKEDKIYANNIYLEEEVKNFEFIFIRNCIVGILDFLNKRN